MNNALTTLQSDLELLTEVVIHLRENIQSNVRKKKYRSKLSTSIKEAKYKQEYNKNNRNKQRAWSNKQHYKNRDKKIQRLKTYYDVNKETIHRTNALKIYGISIDDYNVIFKKQNGNCAICGKNQMNFKKRLHVDHCHVTKRIRGLLCQKCNMAVGLFDDNIDLLHKAKQYLTLPYENSNI